MARAIRLVLNFLILSGSSICAADDLSQFPWMLSARLSQTKDDIAKLATTQNQDIQKSVAKITVDKNGVGRRTIDHDHWRIGNFIRDSSQPELSFFFRDSRLIGIRVVHQNLSMPDVERMLRQLVKRYSLENDDVERHPDVGEITCAFRTKDYSVRFDWSRRHPVASEPTFYCDYTVVGATANNDRGTAIDDD